MAEGTKQKADKTCRKIKNGKNGEKLSKGEQARLDSDLDYYEECISINANIKWLHSKDLQSENKKYFLFLIEVMGIIVYGYNYQKKISWSYDWYEKVIKKKEVIYFDILKENNFVELVEKVQEIVEAPITGVMDEDTYEKISSYIYLNSNGDEFKAAARKMAYISTNNKKLSYYIEQITKGNKYPKPKKDVQKRQSSDEEEKENINLNYYSADFEPYYAVIKGAHNYTLHYYKGDETSEIPKGQYGYVYRGTVVKVLGYALYKNRKRNWIYIEAVITDDKTKKQIFKKGFISNEAIGKEVNVADKQYRRKYLKLEAEAIKERPFQFLNGKPVKKFGAVYSSKAEASFVRNLPHRNAKLRDGYDGFIDNFETVSIISEHVKGWYLISYRNGKMGYINKNYVIIAPAPGFKLHKVVYNETAIGIAEKNYGDNVENNDRDLRFYVNVLAVYNQSLGINEENWENVKLRKDKLTLNWKDAKLKTNQLIWIPSVELANELKNKISSGSRWEGFEAFQGPIESLSYFPLIKAGILAGVLEFLVETLVGFVELPFQLGNIIASYIIELATGEKVQAVEEFEKIIKDFDLQEFLDETRENILKDWKGEGKNYFEKHYDRGVMIGKTIAYAVATATLIINIGKLGFELGKFLKKISGNPSEKLILRLSGQEEVITPEGIRFKIPVEGKNNIIFAKPPKFSVNPDIIDYDINRKIRWWKKRSKDKGAPKTPKNWDEKTDKPQMTNKEKEEWINKEVIEKYGDPSKSAKAGLSKDYKHPDAEYIAEVLNTDKKTFEREIKPLILEDTAKFAKKINAENPDILFNIKNGKIVLENQQTKQTIETDKLLINYKQGE